MDNNIFSFILRYSKRQQILITVITVLSFPFLFYSLELPKIIVNDALGGLNFPRTYFGIEFSQQAYLLTLCVILFFLLIANGLFLMSLNTFKNKSSERMLRRLRYMLYQRILRFPVSRFQRVSQGELSAMVAAETELIREFISDAFALPLFQGGTLLTVLFFMFKEDPILGLAAVSLIPLQAYIIPKLQKRINLMGRTRVKRARAMSGRISETVSGIRDVRSNNVFTYSLSDFSKHLQGLFLIRYEIFKLKFFMKFLNTFMLRLTPLLFYSVGGILILQGRLTIGALVAVLAAYNNLTNPWKELLRYYQRWGDAQIKYQTLVSAFDIPNLMDEKALEPDENKIVPLNQPISFQDVTVVDDDGIRALEDISFSIKSGGHLALVADATTRDALANCLTQSIRPNSGNILVGETNLNRIPLAVLGSRIGYAGSDSYIFEGTIEYNSVFGILHNVPSDRTSEAYDFSEASDSGNSPYDPDADWKDLSTGRFSNYDELKQWWAQVVHALDFEELLFQRALTSPVDPELFPDLPDKIVAARKEIVKIIQSDEELSQLIHPYEFDRYNPNASIGANILFAEPKTEEFDYSHLGDNALVRSVLHEVGLDTKFVDIGFQLARQVNELFNDPEADPGLLQNFSFIDVNTLAELQQILTKTDNPGDLKFDKKTQKTLISMTMQLIAARHRLGFITEEIQEQVLAARKLFHERASEEQKASLAIFDPDAFNEKLSLGYNLIMGRISRERVNAEQRVFEFVNAELKRLDLYQDVVFAGTSVEVGIGGQRIPVAARQKLAVARCLMKRPDILVINEALNALDKESTEKIRQNIIKLLPDLTLIWINGEVPEVHDNFDEILVLKNGRIERRISPQGEEIMEEKELVEEVDETSADITSEYLALTRVPLFRDVRPVNLKLLAFGSRRVKFDPGEYLVRQGEEGQTAFLILSGDVDVLSVAETENETIIGQLGRNDLLGETSLLATVPRTASCRAASRVEALEIEKDVFLQLIESDSKVAANVARRASGYLAQTLERLHNAA